MKITITLQDFGCNQIKGEVITDEKPPSSDQITPAYQLYTLIVPILRMGIDYQEVQYELNETTNALADTCNKYQATNKITNNLITELDERLTKLSNNQKDMSNSTKNLEAIAAQKDEALAKLQNILKFISG